MGFENFFKKQTGQGVSEETYPGTKILRDNWDAIQTNSQKSVEHFDNKFERELVRMFGPVRREGVRSAELTEEETADIKNFIEYASKRLAAGAVSSEMFHKEIEKGKVGNALRELAPPRNVGHDSIHAMVAYAHTNGRSLVPAYTKLDEKNKLVWKDDLANLEESYVIAFSELDDMTDRLKKIAERDGLEGESLVLAAIEEWESEQGKKHFRNNYPNQDFLREFRSPEFVSIVRNLLHNLQQEEPDKNFVVHEFQRILSPLLERLRSKEESGV